MSLPPREFPPESYNPRYAAHAQKPSAEQAIDPDVLEAMRDAISPICPPQPIRYNIAKRAAEVATRLRAEAVDRATAHRPAIFDELVRERNAARADAEALREVARRAIFLWDMHDTVGFVAAMSTLNELATRPAAVLAQREAPAEPPKVCPVCKGAGLRYLNADDTHGCKRCTDPDEAAAFVSRLYDGAAPEQPDPAATRCDAVGTLGGLPAVCILETHEGQHRWIPSAPAAEQPDTPQPAAKVDGATCSTCGSPFPESPLSCSNAFHFRPAALPGDPEPTP